MSTITTITTKVKKHGYAVYRYTESRWDPTQMEMICFHFDLVKAKRIMDTHVNAFLEPHMNIERSTDADAVSEKYRDLLYWVNVIDGDVYTVFCVEKVPCYS
jgi:hypothetical protein